MGHVAKLAVAGLLVAVAPQARGQEKGEGAPDKIPTIPVIVRHVKNLGTRSQASRDLIDEAVERATEIWQQKDIQFGTPQHGDPANDIDPAQVKIKGEVTLSDILVSAPIANPVRGGGTDPVPTILTGPEKPDGSQPVLKSDGSDTGVTLEETLAALDKAAGAPAGSPIVIYPIPQITPHTPEDPMAPSGGAIALSDTPGKSGIIGVNDSHAGETQAHEIGHRLGIVDHKDDTVMAAKPNRDIGPTDPTFPLGAPKIDNTQTATAKSGTTKFDAPREDRQKTRWDKLQDEVAKDPELVKTIADLEKAQQDLAGVKTDLAKADAELTKLDEQLQEVREAGGEAKGIETRISDLSKKEDALLDKELDLEAKIAELKQAIGAVVTPKADSLEIHIR